MTGAEIWMMRLLVIFGAAIGVFFVLMFLRAKYARDVHGHVYCLFWSREGNLRWKRLPVSENGTIILPGKKKRRPKMFMVADHTTGTYDYPGGLPKFLQSKIKACVYDEDCWEPLLNRTGKLILDPQRLHNLYNQAWSAIGAEKGADELKEREQMQGKPARAGGMGAFKVIVIVLIIAGLCVGGYYLFTQIDFLKAATGVG